MILDEHHITVYQVLSFRCILRYLRRRHVLVAPFPSPSTASKRTRMDENSHWHLTHFLKYCQWRHPIHHQCSAVMIHNKLYLKQFKQHNLTQVPIPFQSHLSFFQLGHNSDDSELSEHNCRLCNYPYHCTQCYDGRG